MTTDYLNEEGEKNAQHIALDFSSELSMIDENLNSQMEILHLYLLSSSTDPYVEQDGYTSMLFTALYKNLISLYSSKELTTKGLYGSARIIFRNIYEFLIISKTVALSENQKLLKRWETGENISLRKDVFAKVVSPNSQEMKDLWKTLCEFTHGTIYSQQIDLQYKIIKNDVAFNLVCIKILLDMNYHVLNTYAANRSVQYYAGFMADCKEKGLFANKKQMIRAQLSSMRKTLQKEPKKVVTDFCRRWIFK